MEQIIHEMNYLMYEYVFEEDSKFVDYLKTDNGGGIIKNYHINMNQILPLIQKLLKKYDISLKLINDNIYQCILRRNEFGHTDVIVHIEEGYAESKLPSMAICLAVLDLFDKKDLYIEEAEKIVEELEKYRKLSIKELETRGIDTSNIDNSLF